MILANLILASLIAHLGRPTSGPFVFALSICSLPAQSRCLVRVYHRAVRACGPPARRRRPRVHTERDDGRLSTVSRWEGV
ncbi:hypothetical protein DFH06DRAFT_62377 [Mycena polygramma]|nr:hypothetical protein DFH06DRAFT_62377 [Mycena polygramma]